MSLRAIFGLVISAFWVFFLILAGCKDSSSSNEQDQDIYPDSMLSYSRHIRPIFLEDCAMPGGCHHSSVKDGGLDLETDPPNFQGNHGPVIQPLSSTGSLLYQLLFTTVNGIPRMPPPEYSTYLSDPKIKAIGTWIDEGANPSN